MREAYPDIQVIAVTSSHEDVLAYRTSSPRIPVPSRQQPAAGANACVDL